MVCYYNMELTTHTKSRNFFGLAIVGPTKVEAELNTSGLQKGLLSKGKEGLDASFEGAT